MQGSVGGARDPFDEGATLGRSLRRHSTCPTRKAAEWDDDAIRERATSRRAITEETPMTMTRGQEPGSRTLWHFGLEVRRTSRGFSLFRGEERLSPLGRTKDATVASSAAAAPRAPRSRGAGLRSIQQSRSCDAARSDCSTDAVGEEGVRADVAVLLAKKLAVATRGRR